MESLRPWLMLLLLGCGVDEVGEIGCVLAFDDADVCFDQAPEAACDGDPLAVSCDDAGYTVAVESCAVRIAGTEGGALEPGLCPVSEAGS